MRGLREQPAREGEGGGGVEEREEEEEEEEVMEEESKRGVCVKEAHGSPISRRRRTPVVQNRMDPLSRGRENSRRIWYPTDLPSDSALSAATL